MLTVGAVAPSVTAMNDKERTSISKRLSYVLRHRPGSIGVQVDDAGWVEVEELLDGLALHGLSMTLDMLTEVVDTNPKQRFEFSSDRLLLRARQGHSIEVDLGYEPVVPPDVLFHGTPRVSVESILATGLQKRRRHHVHMSTDRELLLEVARRRGPPVLLRIDAAEMHRLGHEFYVTENDVWLTDRVPPEFLDVVNDDP